METTLLSAYQALIQTHELRADPSQQKALQKLDDLRQTLENTYGKRSFYHKFWKRFRSLQLIKGLYIFGPVGRGKTLLMDLFYAYTQISRKKRIHFHAFMQEIQHKMKVKGKTAHPVEEVVNDLASQVHLLCFDEFMVEHIADAMILKSLFEKLFEKGVVVVATANTPPEDLYKDGFHRERFLPFIHTLCQHVELYELTGPLDYRAERKGKGDDTHLFTPLDTASEEGLCDVFKGLTNQLPHPGVIHIGERPYQVRGSAQDLVWFSFSELCEKARGSKDYLALSHVFERWIISDVPQFDAETSNEAKRFQVLIDILYEAGVKLWMSAASLPSLLALHEEQAFKRTASRLNHLLQGGCF